jgi:hypothetical protein
VPRSSVGSAAILVFGLQAQHGTCAPTFPGI